MNVTAEIRTDRVDIAKLLGALSLFVGGVFAFYYFEGYSPLIRVPALLLVAGIALFIVYHTTLGQRVWQFVDDSRAEVRKVVWPTRQETMQTTLVVFLMVFLMGLLLWLFDMMLMAIVRALTGYGG